MPGCQPSTPARRQRGYSLFEFALAAALFAVMVGVAANRINLYQQELEIVAAEQLVVSLRAALQMKMSQLTASQRRHEIAAALDENPIGWLSQKPENYLGEYFSPDNEKLASGNWYFDRDNKTLVYLLIRPRNFAFGSSILLKFKVESSRSPSNPAFAVPAAEIENVSLVQVFDQPGINGQ